MQGLLLIPVEVGHDPGHEAGAEILEGAGGAMEELQHVGLGIQRNYLGIEGIGIHDDFLQVIVRNLSLHKGLYGLISNLSDTRAERGQLHRHIQAASCCVHATDNSCLEVNPNGRVPSIGINHFVFPFGWEDTMHPEYVNRLYHSDL